MHKDWMTPSDPRPPFAAAPTIEPRDDSATRATTSRSARASGRRPIEAITPLEAMQLLRIEDVCRLLRISKPTFWRLRRRADFPPPTAVTERVMAWSASDIQAWINRRQVPSRR